MLLECWFCCNLWVLNKGKTGSFYLIFLVLNYICKFGLLSGLMFVIFSPLLDRCKPWFVALGKLAVNVGSLRRLILLPFAFKVLVHLLNLLFIFLLALRFQLGHRPGIWLNWAWRVIWIGLPHRQKVIVIKDDTTLLHDSERTQCTRLLHIPDHFLINALVLKVNELTIMNKMISYEKASLHCEWLP